MLNLPNGTRMEGPNLHLCLLAHDLNNMLTVVLGHCDLLLAKPEALSPDALERLRKIRNAAQFMAEQIQRRNCPIGYERSADAAKA
jgi:signal transduction histidine kinase